MGVMQVLLKNPTCCDS